jgi:hypothetical protein
MLDNDGLPHGFATESPTVEAPKRRKANRHSARAKGKTGEREIVALFIGAMERVERKYQGALTFSGKVNRNYDQAAKGGADLNGVPLVSVEVKRHETIKVNDWWQQCTRQAQAGEIPVLFYRVNNSAWQCVTYVALNDLNGLTVRYVRATVDSDDFFRYYELIYERFIREQLGINHNN